MGTTSPGAGAAQETDAAPFRDDNALQVVLVACAAMRADSACAAMLPRSAARTPAGVSSHAHASACMHARTRARSTPRSTHPPAPRHAPRTGRTRCALHRPACNPQRLLLLPVYAIVRRGRQGTLQQQQLRMAPDMACEHAHARFKVHAPCRQRRPVQCSCATHGWAAARVRACGAARTTRVRRVFCWGTLCQ